MVLRSQNCSNLTQNTNKSNVRCHYCRSKNNIKKSLVCSNSPDCKHAFCISCIKAHFASESHTNATEHWICLVCRGLCNCARCQERIKDDIKALEAEPEIENNTGEILYVKEWRKGALLANESFFKGPKTYPEACMEINESKKVKSKKSKPTHKASSKNKKSSSDESEFIPDKKMQNSVGRHGKKGKRHERSSSDGHLNASKKLRASSPQHKGNEEEIGQANQRPTVPVFSPNVLPSAVPSNTLMRGVFPGFPNPNAMSQFPYYSPYSYMYPPYMDPNSYMNYAYPNNYYGMPGSSGINPYMPFPGYPNVRPPESMEDLNISKEAMQKSKDANMENNEK